MQIDFIILSKMFWFIFKMLEKKDKITEEMCAFTTCSSRQTWKFDSYVECGNVDTLLDFTCMTGVIVLKISAMSQVL